MTATVWDLAATTTVEDNTPETLARRLRVHLQSVATQRLPITYQEAAKGLLLSPPNTTLKTVYDPEIPSDIYELGLIYKTDIGDDRVVAVDMTLTTPNCPSAAELPGMVENAVASVPGVRDAKVTIVWDPPWDPSRMSDEARVGLNMW